MRTPEEQAAYIEHLEAEVARLKKELGISGITGGLTFQQRTGIWTDQSGNFYCPTCLAEDKRHPLKVETHGWRCTTRSHYFANPDAGPVFARSDYRPFP